MSHNDTYTKAHRLSDLKQQSLLYGLVLLLLLVAGFAILWALGLGQKNHVGNLDLSSHHQVTSHLQDLDRELQLRREIMQLSQEEARSIRTLDNISVLQEVPIDGASMGVSLEQENLDRRVYEDLYGRDGGGEFASDPRAKINSDLARDQWQSDYEQRLRAEYIRSFLEKARSQGYEVQLNDQLQVVAVKRVPTQRAYRDPQSTPSVKPGGSPASN